MGSTDLQDVDAPWGHEPWLRGNRSRRGDEADLVSSPGRIRLLPSAATKRRVMGNPQVNSRSRAFTVARGRAVHGRASDSPLRDRIVRGPDPTRAFGRAAG